ncbi:MAG: hypothetical protein C0454_00355 [Parvibaculum sp.]|jgi:ornithine decarboxylase|nr:hypothetical protein [Parvibaculum sp.]
MHVMTSYASVSELIRGEAPDSPLLCFSPASINERVKQFLTHFPGETGWAVKSNPHPLVVRAVIEAGIRAFDVASRHEIDLILQHCPSATLHFNHPVKAPEDIAYAWHSAGIRSFAIDCPEELEKIDAVLDGAGEEARRDTVLTIRFRNTRPAGTGNYSFDEKFGARPGEAAGLLRRVAGLGYRTGLTFHPGSQNRDPESYATLVDLARGIAAESFARGTAALAHINVGGGFPCFYPGGPEPELKTYFAAIANAASSIACPIICEPGRALVAESANLLTRINLRRKDDPRLYINEGIYGSFMETPFVDFQPPVRAYSADGRPFPEAGTYDDFQIWGATCDSLDRLRMPVSLPSAIGTGDFIEFGMMGAYTNATATHFNGMEPARLIAIDEITSWPVGATAAQIHCE